MYYQKSNKTDSFLEKIDQYRLITSQKISKENKAKFSQYFTSVEIARFMTSMFSGFNDKISLLDPGAGIGNLSAAFIEKIIQQEIVFESLSITCYEIDITLLKILEETLNTCKEQEYFQDELLITTIVNEDFITDTAEHLLNTVEINANEDILYSHCIMNPPYQKINSNSSHRKALRSVGIETTNLYAGFLALSILRLREGGEIVTIIPRSFCNGVYFRPFRQFLLDHLNIRQIHVFQHRNKAFKDDNVLQENIILYGKREPKQGQIKITSCEDSSFLTLTERVVPASKVIKPDDENKIFHIAIDEYDQIIVDKMNVFSHSLEDLNLEVSTGPIVDFRLKNHFEQIPSQDSYPLIYPSHIVDGEIVWPNINGKKPNAIKPSEATDKYLFKNGWYVLIRRFSSKEEKKRIHSSVFNPEKVNKEYIGFENHLNVLHFNKSGIDEFLAKGLKTYLDSSLVDQYFRQFSGHTQVNASDLKQLKYPNKNILTELGKSTEKIDNSQKSIDSLIESLINRMAPKQLDSGNGIKQKIDEALQILKILDLPNEQQNERSALTLLALIDLKPNDIWSNASAPLMGITPIMTFIEEHYKKTYAPNSRETIRRFTMHQFIDAGIAIPNPDKPLLHINSPKWVYQIESSTLKLLQAYQTENWDNHISSFLNSYKSLGQKYAKKREMNMIPLRIDGADIQLSPGDHSKLIKEIIEKFGPRYAPDGKILYVGDTGSKMGFFNKDAFAELGLKFNDHGKFPDVVLHYLDKNWLLLIEAVTSHGPVNPKRLSELKKIFAESSAGIVYVTAFPDKRTMAKYVSDISWETEVWVSESPGHLIHFDGDKFLGPY